MLRVDVEFGYHGYRKKWTSIFDISFQFVTDFDWVLKAMGKRQAIGSMGGHGFEGQNLNIGFGWPDIIFKMGMGRQNLSKYYQTIRLGGNVSTGHGSDYWRLMNTSLNRVIPSWTTWSRVWSRVFCGSWMSDGGGTWWNQPLGFIQVYNGLHHRATRLWTFWSGHSPQPFPILSVSLVLAPRIPSIRNLDTGYHGFVGALAMPLNLQNIQFESGWSKSRMVHTVYILNVINC